MAENGVKVGVLRGRENSFPDAFIAKVNAMGEGVSGRVRAPRRARSSTSRCPTG